jgi:alpha-ketoglutarate-dependent taurine dioxygenase
MTVTTEPISPEIGVEVSGLKGPELVDRARADECQALLDAHGVVVYREVHIGDEDLLAFTEMLGTVVIPKMGGLKDLPAVDVISMDPGESVLAPYRKSTIFWHLDGTMDALPQKATLLTAIEVSDEGGDTEFAHTYAAYEALPEDEKERIEDLRVVHSFAAAQILTHPDPTDEERADWAKVPSREHPLVWKRKDGRRSLLIGSTADHIVGLPEEESRALLDHLVDWVTQPRFVLRHHWHKGDLVAWDNTGLLHRAIPYEATSRRLLHRTTLVGEEDVA